MDNKITLYRHYKNKDYKLLGEVVHSESLEKLVLYKTRYKNDLGALWVRPKSMFYEEIISNGTKQPRFSKVNFEIKHYRKITPDLQKQILNIFKTVFLNFSIDNFNTKINTATKVHLVCAFDQKTMVGCKLGYQIDNSTFYSWLGAVATEYRGVGLGCELLLKQHEYCKNSNYKEILTKTKNTYKNMIMLNLKNGFLITKTENLNNDIKIIMSKELNTFLL